MASQATIHMIECETVGDISEVRQKYLELFRDQIPEFLAAMGDAFEAWYEFDKNPEKDVKKAYVSAQVLLAINGHIVSTRLFLSGHFVPSGNLERQVLESIGTALLFSDRCLPFLDHYINGAFSTSKALTHLTKHWKRLHVHKEAIETAKEMKEFYDKLSHPTFTAVAFSISMACRGVSYLGASFDEGKISVYKQEFARRLSLARTLTNFISGVSQNWEDQNHVGMGSGL